MTHAKLTDEELATLSEQVERSGAKTLTDSTNVAALIAEVRRHRTASSSIGLAESRCRIADLEWDREHLRTALHEVRQFALDHLRDVSPAWRASLAHIADEALNGDAGHPSVCATCAAFAVQDDTSAALPPASAGSAADLVHDREAELVRKLNAQTFRADQLAHEVKVLTEAPIPMLLTCPACNARHVDEGDFATKVHHTHACQFCGMCWRPAVRPTCGVRFLPGFKNDAKEHA